MMNTCILIASLAILNLLTIISVSAEQTSFKPGEVWCDTDGNPIDAHGGGLLYHEGVYYWYGEIKNSRTYTPGKTYPRHSWRSEGVGVNCYSSTDLLNWKYEGAVLPAVNDRSHKFGQHRVIERPKVIYNAKTNKFVMWLHNDSRDYRDAMITVAVCDTPTGKFTYLDTFRPNAGVWPTNFSESDKQPSQGNRVARDFDRGQMSRDMTLFVDDDGTAYHLHASEGNATLHISQLTDDYLRPAGKYKRLFIGRSMEAPTIFKQDGKYYFIASGCTGWAPNEARSAVADSIWGPWKELGNPCRGKDAKLTFHSQSTYVLPVADRPGKFIFMADQWNASNLRDSRYIWLPVRFDDKNRPTLHWQDEWNLSEL